MNEPNWKNRTLFHGDNLDFLRAMNSESVDLIATEAWRDRTEVSGRRCPSTGKSTTPRSRRNGRTMARRRHRFFASRIRVKEPEGPKWSRKEMYNHLVKQRGMKCQGCDRTFADPRYLELDHNVPRADGGINHVTNRILLCSPCNRAKSNIYTLTGLRRLNAKETRSRIEAKLGG